MKRWLNKERISFYNLEHKDERLIVEDVIRWIQGFKEIKLGDRLQGPWYEAIKGEYNSISFSLICDFEEGVDLICPSENEAVELNRYFNK